MTADQALDELMHGDYDSLLASCNGEREALGLDQSVSFHKMSYAELANWWVTYMYWDEGAQSWLPKSMKEDYPFWNLNDLPKA